MSDTDIFWKSNVVRNAIIASGGILATALTAAVLAAAGDIQELKTENKVKSARIDVLFESLREIKEDVKYIRNRVTP